MTENLIINPELLYRIYSPNITIYYEYSFLPEYTSIDTDIFYDILNSLSDKELTNMDLYLYKQWILTKRILLNLNSSPLKRKKDIINLDYSKGIVTNDDLNTKLSNFINKDKVIGIYIMNKLLKFLYPC